MRFFFVFGLLLLIISILCVGSAEQVSDEDNISENKWNGTWASDYYTLFFSQNGSEISGIYEPYDIELYDPGLLVGSISDDGNIFSGIWTESGPLTLVISDDGLSYSGIGGVRSDGDMNESETYSTNGTRKDSQSDPDNIWNGTWMTGRSINTWVQEGKNITGSYEPIMGVEDEPGIFEGIVSEDGKTVLGKWLETGNFSFSLSENALFFNGSYDILLNPSAGADSWNGTKLS